MEYSTARRQKKAAQPPGKGEESSPTTVEQGPGGSSPLGIKPGRVNPSDILALQRTVGNQAVIQLLASRKNKVNNRQNITAAKAPDNVTPREQQAVEVAAI